MSSGAAHGGSVRMFGIAATSGRCERRLVRRLSTRTGDHLWMVATVGLGCAAVIVVVAAQIQLGSNHATAYLAPGLALPVLCVTALPKSTLFEIVARLVPRKQLHHLGPNWSSAIRPTGRTDDLLGTGSGIGRTLADFRR
jgi:hypothetical protein